MLTFSNPRSSFVVCIVGVIKTNSDIESKEIDTQKIIEVLN